MLSIIVVVWFFPEQFHSKIKVNVTVIFHRARETRKCWHGSSIEVEKQKEK
jgi:hypothetical protein